MAADRSRCKDSIVPPREYTQSPRADEMEFLDCVMHVSEPDFGAFTENFSLQQESSSSGFYR